MRLLLISCLLFVVSMAQTDCTNDSECSLSTAQCEANAEQGMCGTDPDLMLSCCKTQCKVECGADPCTCSGLAPGTVPNAEDYGSECASWDITSASPFFDSCTALDVNHCGDDNWCIGEWCYVLDESCASASESSRFPGYFFSYDQCGTPDCYTCTLPGEDPCPDECPHIPEGSGIDCDCPLYCFDSWIGDGQCDRREGGYDCRNCLSFYTDSNGDPLTVLPNDVDDPEVGTFDCNAETNVCDCDPEIVTSLDPDYVAHNLMVVDGEMYCSDMIGVCGDISFQANIEQRDTSDSADPNDYGTLRSRGVGRQGWFALQIEDDGNFRAELGSTRSNELDEEVDHPIEYVIWGPYSSYSNAQGSCATKTVVDDVVTLSGSGLGAPLSQSSSANRQHTITINGVTTGEVYVLMISDSNPVQGTTTLNVLADNEDDATVSCDLQVTDAFACQPKGLIDLTFTDETEIIRHNLAGYWAENAVGQLNDVPLGIYYSKVGTYVDPDSGESHTLGLRVEALNPGAYRCKTDGDNGNNCAVVMTGLDTDNIVNEGSDGTMPMYAVDLDDVFVEDDLSEGFQYLLGEPKTEHFGQINMLAGAVELKFNIVLDDTDNTDPNRNGVPLGESWDRVKLSIFDIDSKTADGETIQIINAAKICPGGVVATGETYPYYLRDRNYDYLDYSNNDFQSASGYRWDIFSGCWVRRSSTGTSVFQISNLPNCVTDIEMTTVTACRNNNPVGPDDLDEMSKLMSVEAEFENVGTEGMQVNFIVSRDHAQGRNLWFGGESVSIGRKCCKDVVFCEHGYINAELECTGHSGDESECSVANCCNEGPSSHGDPIIHTFHGECYDLHKDGNYLASAHPAWEHEVHVAVYNEYMRQISITNLEGDVLLSVNNFGEILNNGWVGYLDVQTVPCPEDYQNDDCVGEYINVSFDAQDLYYDVQVGLRHNYKDQSLKEGEIGYHMDIYPQPHFKSFNPRRGEYSGLYFYNPLPEQLPTCTY